MKYMYAPFIILLMILDLLRVTIANTSASTDNVDVSFVQVEGIVVRYLVFIADVMSFICIFIFRKCLASRCVPASVCNFFDDDGLGFEG